MRNIFFNSINNSKNYLKHVEYLLSDYQLIRNKHFSIKCLKVLQPLFLNSNILLTHSATAGLEIIAHLLNIEKGDEVILPSFTFVSSANSFVSQGSIPVFVDIEKEGLSIDLGLVEKAITPKTKAVVAVHYAGHPCDLNRLKEICMKHQIYLIEDAAMAFGNNFEGIQLGGIGDFGVISFDVTKQISSIQGGLLIVNNEKFQKRANNIYHNGTNRSNFTNGIVPHYEWVDVGSKYQMNELNAAFLYEDLNQFLEVLTIRNKLSKIYYKELLPLKNKHQLTLMPQELLEENYHEFYVLLKDKLDRDKCINYLAERAIEAMFHYTPLHNSKKGRLFINNELPNTTEISDRLLRLPLHAEMDEEDVRYIAKQVISYCDE
jgi:dTDP-4-amino-4,6-dideoxygalactose transaminase